jgi:uncharacterized damage-inducible protein DinB
MNLQDSIRAILLRELRTVQRELEAYDRDEDIWALPPGISNSAGTLALHVAGNLQSFVGTTLGDTRYVRDRPAEFARRDVPRAELLAELDRAVEAVSTTLDALPDGKVGEPFPQNLRNIQITTGDFLLHLSAHLAFHVGQIDYHRRLVTGSKESVGPVGIPELASTVKMD